MARRRVRGRAPLDPAGGGAARDAPELEPGEEQRRDVEGDQAEREEDKREPVLEHEAVHCAVHAAVGPAEREAGPEHGAERAVEHGDELEAHRHRRHTQIERLEQVVRLLGDVDLDDAVVGKAR